MSSQCLSCGENQTQHTCTICKQPLCVICAQKINGLHVEEHDPDFVHAGCTKTAAVASTSSGKSKTKTKAKKKKKTKAKKKKKKKRRAMLISRPMHDSLITSAMGTEKSSKAKKTRVDYRYYAFEVLNWFVQNEIKNCLMTVPAKFQIAILEERGTDPPRCTRFLRREQYYWFDFTKIDKFAIPFKAYLESLREILHDEDEQKNPDELDPAKVSSLKKYRSALYHYRASAVCQTDGQSRLQIDAEKIRAYEAAMKSFMGGKTKEHAQLKLSGKRESNAKDKITDFFYSKVCYKYCEMGKPHSHFFWVTLAQSCGRGKEIGHINTSHFSVEDDSIVITFYDTKGDQTSEIPIDLHFFANPFAWHKCLFFSLGALVLTQSGPFEKGKIFSGKTPNSTVREQLNNLFSEEEMERQFGLHPDGVGLHSVRKYILTKIANASEKPPHPTAIDIRGGHNLELVKGAYYSYDSRGDCRIGRLMIADEGTPEINCYPPHWIDPEDAFVWETIDDCCPWLSQEGPNFRKAAVFAIASVVHASEEVVASNDLYPALIQTELFQRKDVLKKLRDKLTGIYESKCNPPMVRHGICTSDLTLARIENNQKNLPRAVAEAMGTHHGFDAVLDEMKEMRNLLQSTMDFDDAMVCIDSSPNSTFTWDDGSQRHIPQYFRFNAANVMSAWVMWHSGNRHFKAKTSDGMTKTIRIIPYKHINSKDCKKVRHLQRARSRWRKVMGFLENELEKKIPNWHNSPGSSNVRRAVSQLVPSSKKNKYEGNHPWMQSVDSIYNNVMCNDKK